MKKRHRRVRSSRPQRELSVHPKAKCHVTVVGCDNTVIVRSPRVKANIMVYGFGNTVIIEEETWMSYCSHIIVGTPDCPTREATVHIGKNCQIQDNVTIRLMEAASSVSMGDNTLVADWVEIWCTDSHSIADADGILLNRGRCVSIGKHCWLGMGCKIGKNSAVPDESVVGWGSVVTHSFSEPNVIIAGTPAKVVRSNIHWDTRRPIEFDNAVPYPPEEWRKELRLLRRKKIFVFLRRLFGKDDTRAGCR